MSVDVQQRNIFWSIWLDMLQEGSIRNMFLKTEKTRSRQ